MVSMARNIPYGLKRNLPDQVELVLFDFDGVFTDNRVWVDQNGQEMIVCNRSDGLGIKLLREAGFHIAVLSTETNPVVSARCRKLEIECHQSVENKAGYLLNMASERQVNIEYVIYVGNDVNDLECMQTVGFSVAVQDANQKIKQIADLVLHSSGGHGAVRELCELLLETRRTNYGPTC